MGFRGPKTEGKKETVSFRCPPELLQYIQRVIEEEKREQTEILVAALRLDRDLQVKLRDVYPRIQAYAAGRNLSLQDELSEVFAQLIRIGIASLESSGQGPAK